MHSALPKNTENLLSLSYPLTNTITCKSSLNSMHLMLPIILIHTDPNTVHRHTKTARTKWTGSLKHSVLAGNHDPTVSPGNRALSAIWYTVVGSFDVLWPLIRNFVSKWLNCKFLMANVKAFILLRELFYISNRNATLWRSNYNVCFLFYCFS